jgi:adenylate cyclase class 1
VKQRIIPNYHIDDGFDRQNLSVIRKRFLAINEDRLTRMRDALPERHRLFLDTLALMFHTNHPMLPGFVDRQAPCKISNYKPSKQEIQAAKAIARSLTLSYENNQEEDIWGIYVMGSVGTIAQSTRSDLDIWLCHKPGLSRANCETLKKKCDRISEWAAERRLEVHFFLMDCEAFKRGRLSSLDEESSGSAQRLLLLDEFYRSSIYIAGRQPLWWYVPQKNESQYTEHTQVLLKQRFLNPKHVLDFGGLASIPGDEFIGAGVWQLYKAIASPYKSVLKLLLLEEYLSEYPNIRPLSLDFKHEVFLGQVDVDALDAYTMTYERIEKYLKQKNQTSRLDLVRRSFYFKINRPMSGYGKQITLNWQRQALKTLVEQWHWDDETLQFLDNRKKWKATTVAGEKALLVNELNHSYHFLMEFADKHDLGRAISAEELNVLGRKLQATFERRPGKIEWINPGISKDLSEETVNLRRSGSQQEQMLWSLFAGENNRTKVDDLLKSGRNLSEIILWAVYNGIIDSYSQIDVSMTPYISTVELRRLLNCVRNWLPDSSAPVAHNHFRSSARPVKVLMLINSGGNTQHDAQRETTSIRLSNADEWIRSIDLISLNSWNEVHCRRFDKSQALLDAALEYLTLAIPHSHQTIPELLVECIGTDNNALISKYTQLWFKDLTECFYHSQGLQRRYVLKLYNKTHCIRFSGARPQIDSFKNEDTLITALSAGQKSFSSIKISKNGFKHSLLPIISAKMKRNTISVAFKKLDIGMSIMVADERGSITQVVLRGRREQSPLIPLHRFLRSVVKRQARSQPELLSDFGICPIYFYEAHDQIPNPNAAKQIPISQNIQQTDLFEVKAIAHTDDNQNIEYDFYCDDQEFSSHSFKDQLHIVVAQFILARRKNGENYPIYITDLDLSLCSHLIAEQDQLQTSHYLKIKHALETKLNQAIGVLVRA